MMSSSLSADYGSKYSGGSSRRWFPGVERHPLKKLNAREEELLTLLHRWRNEAGKAGHEIKRIVVAYEAGRDGFWLRAGCRLVGWRPTLSIPGAWRCRASTGAPRPIA